MSDAVPVSRALLTLGGLVLVSSLTTSAFLVGRATAPAPAVVVHAPSAPAPAPLSAVDRVAAADGSSQDVPARSASLPHTSGSQADVPTIDAPASAAEVDERDLVRAYFQSLDAEQGSILGALDPHALVQQALTGDTQGIDSLIEQHTARMKRIAAFQPPASCRAHHRQLLELGKDGQTVMSRLRDGIAGNDLNALMALQGDASRLQRAGDHVTELEDDLRRQFGL